MNILIHLACGIAAYLSLSAFVSIIAQVLIFFRFWPLMLFNPVVEAALTDTLKNTFKLALVIPVYLTFLSWLQGRPRGLSYYLKWDELFALRFRWQLLGTHRMSANLGLYCIFLFATVRAGLFLLFATISVFWNSWAGIVDRLTALVHSTVSGAYNPAAWHHLLKSYIESLRKPPSLLTGDFIATHSDAGSNPVTILSLVLAAAVIAFVAGVYGPRRSTLLWAYALSVASMVLSQASIEITRAELKRPTAIALANELGHEFGDNVVDKLINMKNGVIVVTRGPEGDIRFDFFDHNTDMSQFYREGSFLSGILFIARVHSDATKVELRIETTSGSGSDVNWKIGLLLRAIWSDPGFVLWPAVTKVAQESIMFMAWTPLILLLMIAAIRTGRRFSEAMVIRGQLAMLPAADARELGDLIRRTVLAREEVNQAEERPPNLL